MTNIDLCGIAQLLRTLIEQEKTTEREARKILARIEMPIFGIMSGKSFRELEGDFLALQKAYEELGGTLNDAVFTLSLLLALVVIPEGGLSNRGLVDVTNGRFVDLVVQE